MLVSSPSRETHINKTKMGKVSTIETASTNEGILKKN